MHLIRIILIVLFSTSILVGQERTPDSLFTELNTAKNDTVKIMALIRIAEFHKNSNPDSTLKYLEPAAELANKLKYIKGQAYTERLFGYLAFQKADNETTIKHYKRSLTFFTKLNDNYNIGKQTYFIGVAFVYMGDYKSALSKFYEALDIYEKNGLRSEAADATIGIANVYGRLNNPEKEYEFNFKALKIKEELNDEYGAAAACLNLGKSLIRLNKVDEAIEYTKKGIAIGERLNYGQWLIKGYGNLGSIYAQIGDYKNGLRYFLKCMNLAEAANEKVALSNLYSNIGKLYSELNQQNLAEKYYSKALLLSVEINDLEMMKNNYYSYYEYCMDNKDYKNAVSYLKEYIKIKDSLLNESNTSTLNELQTKYESVQKEKEIVLLNKDKEIQNTLIAQQRLINYSIIIGLLILGIFSVLLYNRLKLTRKQKGLIELQKQEVEQKNEIIEEKQKEILDSIHYAKRIQNTLLAHKDALNDHLKSNFVYFKPKDIVSGDFYWATKKDNLFYLAVCDSTGHGVPGAFMSLLNIGFLNEAINEKNIKLPSEIFNYVRDRLVNSISKEGQQDGFDGILLCLDTKTSKLSYTAAHNAPIIVRDNNILELAKDKMPVGKGMIDKSFSNYELELKPNDSLYLFTDGYADQFGGPNGKKYLYKRFNQLLASLDLHNLNGCLDKLNSSFEDWKGGLEQVDDVLVVGIKI